MKAIVVESEKKQAVLLREDGQFVSLLNRGLVKGDTIMVKDNPIGRRVLALAATAAVFLFVVSSFLYAYNTPRYIVSLDINPGLVMEANVFERVIAIEALNEEAATVIANIEWKNKDVTQVISDALQEIEQEGYFEQNGELFIAAASKNSKSALEMAAKLQAAADDLDIETAQIHSQAVGYEMVQAARQFAMTPGKYNIITRLLGETVDQDNYEEYNNLSVKDLMARFTETKGAIGKEIAAQARENDQEDENGGREIAGQKASEAKERASEARENAAQKATEAAQTAESALEAAESKVSEADGLPVEDNLPAQPTAGEAQETIPDASTNESAAATSVAESILEDLVPETIPSR